MKMTGVTTKVKTNARITKGILRQGIVNGFVSEYSKNLMVHEKRGLTVKNVTRTASINLRY